MDIRPIELADDAAMARMYAVIVAVRRFERPFFEPPPPASVLADLRNEDPGERLHLWGLHDGDELVGVATMWELLLDNTDTLVAQLDVHPDHRCRGHGSAGLAAIVERARRSGRTRIVMDARYPAERAEDHPYRRFAERHGFRLGAVEVNRRLDMPVPTARLAQLGDAARAAYAPDYVIQTYAGLPPEEVLPSLCACMNRVATDAPTGDIDWEEEAMSPQRLRGLAELDDRAGRLRLTAVARAAGTGQVVGYSELAIHESMSRALQSGTLVLAEHRGRRLGLAVKVANLAALHEHRPDAREIFTSNNTDNAWMVAVNQTLGFAPVELVAEFYRRLPGALDPADPAPRDGIR